MKNLRKKLGQNTAEYLIILVLVAVGSIGIFSIFGATIKKQISNVIAAMTGGPVETVDTLTDAKKQAQKGTGMNLNQDEIKRFGE